MTRLTFRPTESLDHMKNLRRLVALTATAAIGSLALTACGSTEQPQAESLDEMSEVTYTVADIDPEGSVHNRALRAFMDEVSEQTDGKVQFEAYTSGSLMPGNEMLAGIGSGTADMGRVISFYFPQELSAGNWFLDQAGNRSTSYPHGLIQSAMAGQQAHMEDSPIRQELEDQNVVPLVNYPTAQQYDLVCTKPVETPEDARGLRVRTGGELHVNEAEALGMVPVPLPVTEMYEGLQRGVIDCVTLQVPGHIDYGLWEVAPHYVPIAMSPLNAMPFVVNKDVWESMPVELQDIMKDSAKKALTTTLANIIDNYERFAVEGESDHGIVFNDPRAIDEQLFIYQRDREGTMMDRAPSGIDSPQQVIDSVENSNDTWLAYLQDDLDLPETERDPESIENSFREVGGIDLSRLWDKIQETDFETN